MDLTQEKKSNLKLKINFENINQSIEGTDLGIILYFIGFFLIGTLFWFTQDPILKELLDFYTYFDIMAVAFVIVHITLNHKNYDYSNIPLLNNALNNENTDLSSIINDDKQKYTFLNFKCLKGKDIAIGIAYVFLGLIILIIANFLINLSFMLIQGGVDIVTFVNTYTFGVNVILQVTRTILIEEMVYRGLILSLMIIFFNSALKIRKNISNLIGILISGITFGFIHIFRYGIDLRPILYLMVLGGVCAILTLNRGIWSAMLLHIINNLIASYSGQLKTFVMIIDMSIIVLLIFLIIGILFVYLISIKIKQFMVHFGYCSVFMIIFFVIGFFTNGLIKSDDFGGFYFEHFHIILFVPIIFILFKERFSTNKKLYSILIGSILGLFISDYLDIINLSLEQLTLTFFYIINFIVVYALLSYYLYFRSHKGVYH